MVTMGIFPFKEKSPWQNWESNPGPYDHEAETLTPRPRGWSIYPNIRTLNFVKDNAHFTVFIFQENMCERL
jgi:hypothetical protein